MIGCGKRMGTGLSDLRAEGGVRVRAESVYAHGPKAAWVQACTRIEARTDAHALKVAKCLNPPTVGALPTGVNSG